ncbi:MAG: glutamine-synthetase adenylyltransferase [Acidobacteria bacterium]|nr:glutamine-synthetase adenylyltransferase [Acidobacteriota bacterium]
MRHLLDAATFRRRERALAHLTALSPRLTDDQKQRLAALLQTCADPDAAVLQLSRMASEKHSELTRIVEHPALLVPLLTVFSQSRFLSDEILEHPDWLPQTVLGGDFDSLLSMEEMEGRLEAFLMIHGAGVPSALHLAQFRRLQLLRILLRDVTGRASLAETTEEISNLADAVLNVSYHHIFDELTRRYGVPRLASSGEPRRCEYSVIALGKLGGRELNYSSDIDLMFVYAGAGETDGERSISNGEFFKRLANLHTELLSTYTSEGMCYRVDLRLRPDGKLGELVMSLDAARKYYQNRARDWELQMLIKARVAAGEPEPGKALLEYVEPMIYTSTTDFTAVEAVSATRVRIQEKLQERKAAGKETDVKLAQGGIRDIEFLVQCLQRLHGGREPWVRHGGTMLALFRLRDKNLLSDLESQTLISAYAFLRHLEHRLQFEDDRQIHTLPQDREQLEVLARRMPPEPGRQTTAGQLLEWVQGYLRDVAEIYERVIHAQKPTYYTSLAAHAAAIAAEQRQWEQPLAGDVLDSNLIRFLDQRAPVLAKIVARSGVRRSGKALQRYLEWVAPNPEWMEWLDSSSGLAQHLIDIFEHSPYFSEQLMRFPDLLEQLRFLCEHPGDDRSMSEADSLEDANDLRRYFRREMFRIQCESVCLRNPVFETLARTSALADGSIRAAYRISLAEVEATHGPAGAAYKPADQMMVVALGRLGTGEFDLGSDADLVFVLPDADGGELEFWTRVAAKFIDRLSAYTREGFMFTVDARLRPNGREGPLVQMETTYKEYFANRAEAWEGLTYMKARAVAGNPARATQFLNELQELDWRRYGQSGRSLKQLRQMRLRLEKEQASDNPLKAGTGGYYDVDFALMYLRLKGAGIFYPALNTPQRIDVIEKMGHLERADAAFLRDAATFYRSLDHGLRIMSGQPEGTLPKSRLQTDTLCELTSRWMPPFLTDQPIEVELAQIQERAREFFDRLFAS